MLTACEYDRVFKLFDFEINLNLWQPQCIGDWLSSQFLKNQAQMAVQINGIYVHTLHHTGQGFMTVHHGWHKTSVLSYC